MAKWIVGLGAVVTVLAIAAGVASNPHRKADRAAAYTGDTNTVVAHETFGAWEIWCLDLGGRGLRYQCDLNHVLRYSPWPDFKAMIPRFYADLHGRPTVRWGSEFGASLAFGGIDTEGYARFRPAPCGKPCILDTDRAAALLERFLTERPTTVTFYEFPFERRVEPLPLDGFADGWARLKELSVAYARRSVEP